MMRTAVFGRNGTDAVGRVEWLGQVRKNGKLCVARRGIGLGILADEVDKPGLWEIAGDLGHGPGVSEIGEIWEIRVSIWTKFNDAVKTLKGRYRKFREICIICAEIKRCRKRIEVVKKAWERDPNNILARTEIQRILKDSSTSLVNRLKDEAT